jgi:hypothetical protein
MLCSLYELLISFFSPCSIPQVILSDIFKAPSDDLGMQAYISTYNTIFLFIAISVAYGMVSAFLLQST